jgi:hypothetical protein
VPVEVEPNHKTVFQNENLQAFRVRLNPGQATLMHTHTHDDVAVRLASASITSQGLGQATAMPETSTPGFTTARDNASRPTSHRVRNVGTSTFDVLDVQLLSRPPAGGGPNRSASCGKHEHARLSLRARFVQKSGTASAPVSAHRGD